MTQLDSLLSEVGPILSNFQFSHPSFREILAARQCADEINSGRLSVNDAYLNFWSNIEKGKPRKISGKYRTIRPEQRLTLAHLSPLLSDKSADALIRAISDNYFLSKKQINFSSPNKFNDAVFEELSLCSRIVGDHPALQNKRRAKQIIDVLMGVIYKCSRAECTPKFQQDLRSRSAKNALSRMKSSYAAMKIISYMNFLEHTPILEYYYPGQKVLLRIGAHETLDSLVKGGAKIDEAALIKNVDFRTDMDSSEVRLLFKYGGIKSFKHILRVLSRKDHFLDSYYYYDLLFVRLLGAIQKYGFEPKLVAQFNNIVTKINYSDFEAIVSYNKALSSFAEKFKELSGKELYDHLESKSIQLFNSEVYKPK